MNAFSALSPARLALVKMAGHFASLLFPWIDKITALNPLYKHMQSLSCIVSAATE
jgi:hypothetical protein